MLYLKKTINIKMENNNQSNGIKRREFLRTGAALAASAFILPLAGTKVFGACRYAQQRHKNAKAWFWYEYVNRCCG